MKYLQLKSENENLCCYEAYLGEKLMARFSWESREDQTALIREICMEPGYESYEDFCGILEFIQYKVMADKKDAMYMEVDGQNRMLTEMLLRFGFYVIDRHLTTGKYGRKSAKCVLKRPVR